MSENHKLELLIKNPRSGATPRYPKGLPSGRAERLALEWGYPLGRRKTLAQLRVLGLSRAPIWTSPAPCSGQGNARVVTCPRNSRFSLAQALTRCNADCSPLRSFEPLTVFPSMGMTCAPKSLTRPQGPTLKALFKSSR